MAFNKDKFCLLFTLSSKGRAGEIKRRSDLIACLWQPAPGMLACYRGQQTNKQMGKYKPLLRSWATGVLKCGQLEAFMMALFRTLPYSQKVLPGHTGERLSGAPLFCRLLANLSQPTLCTVRIGYALCRNKLQIPAVSDNKVRLFAYTPSVGFRLRRDSHP